MGISNIPGSVVYTMPPKVIVNRFTAGGVAPIALSATLAGGYTILSGALTADTYKSVLSISGRGVVFIAGVYKVDGTSRTVGIKVVIDGTDAFDKVSSADTTANAGILAVGIAGYASGSISPQPMPFKSSLDVQIKSSITETDKIAATVAYVTM